QDGRRRRGALHLARRVDAVQERHREVEDCHVGARLSRCGERVAAVAAFGHHLEPFASEEGAEALSHEGMVVGYEDAGRHSAALEGISTDSLVPWPGEDRIS